MDKHPKFESFQPDDPLSGVKETPGEPIGIEKLKAPAEAEALAKLGAKQLIRVFDKHEVSLPVDAVSKSIEKSQEEFREQLRGAVRNQSQETPNPLSPALQLPTASLQNPPAPKESRVMWKTIHVRLTEYDKWRDGLRHTNRGLHILLSCPSWLLATIATLIITDLWGKIPWGHPMTILSWSFGVILFLVLFLLDLLRARDGELGLFWRPWIFVFALSGIFLWRNITESRVSQQTVVVGTSNTSAIAPASSPLAPNSIPEKSKPLTTLHDLFETDLAADRNANMPGKVDIIYANGNKHATVEFRLIVDFATNAEFLKFYIPETMDTFDVCSAIPVSIETARDSVEKYMKGSVLSYANEDSEQKYSGIKFTGSVFVYSAMPMTLEQTC